MGILGRKVQGVAGRQYADRLDTPGAAEDKLEDSFYILFLPLPSMVLKGLWLPHYPCKIKIMVSAGQ